MKKSLSIVLVLLLTAIGAEALASALDHQIHKITETNDKGGSDNKGGKYCSTKPEK